MHGFIRFKKRWKTAVKIIRILLRFPLGIFLSQRRVSEYTLRNLRLREPAQVSTSYTLTNSC